VHLAFGACAFLVKPLGRELSAGLAVLALAYNTLVAPRLGFDRSYRRQGEGHMGGLATYPLAVLVLLLCWPLPLAGAAGAWVVMAVADPVAAAVGSALPRPRVPGNPRKSLVGSLAGFVAASAACACVLAYMDQPRPIEAAMTAAGAGVVAEALPLPIDDNLPVGLAAGAALAFWML